MNLINNLKFANLADSALSIIHDPRKKLTLLQYNFVV